MQPKKILVVGAGAAGLSLAYEILKTGHQVTIVERAPFIGGLCRSFEKHQCMLDVGVHILHSRDPEVEAKAREVIPSEQWVQVERKGKLYVNKREMNWPLNVASLFQLPLNLNRRVFLDQMKKLLGAKKNQTQNNYAEVIQNIYGPTLYENFFRPMTEKFLCHDPIFIHPDWAYSSLRSATKIEDESFGESYQFHVKETHSSSNKDFNIFSFAYDQIVKRSKVEPFYYFKDGYGVLVNSYCDKIKKMQGEVLLNSEVTQFITDENLTIKSALINGEKRDFDYVIWSGETPALLKTLKLNPPPLVMLQSKFVYLFLKNSYKTHQVCYYADWDLSFVRGTILSNHAKEIIRHPQVKDVVCLEYTFLNRFELENSDVKNFAIRDAKKVGLIHDESEVLFYHELNVPNSYPILELDYLQKLNRVEELLRPYSNLITFGRQGTFTYDNADVLIKQAIHHPLVKHLKKLSVEIFSASHLKKEIQDENTHSWR